ncbi:MAG: hypothetical protein P8X69_11510, partial [Maritimibacter sp.]
MNGYCSGSQGGISHATLDRMLAQGSSRQRLVPDGAQAFYIMAQTDDGRVLAHRFVRNVGGTDATNAGPPYEPWRYVGTRELASMDAAPTAPIFTYSDDTGAQDYALQFTDSLQFGGSYHGGERLLAQSVTVDGIPVDPAVAESGRQIAVRRRSIVTSADTSYTV